MSFAPPKQVFLALIAVSWADGRFSATERAGLLQAAEAAALPVDDIMEVQEAMQAPRDLSGFDPSNLSPRSRFLTYALALWLARLDGIVTSGEHETLRSLGDILGLERMDRERASSIALDVYLLPGEARPSRYDFAALDRVITQRMPQLT